MGVEILFVAPGWGVGKGAMKRILGGGGKYLFCLRSFNALREVEGVVQGARERHFSYLARFESLDVEVL